MNVEEIDKENYIRLIKKNEGENIIYGDCRKIFDNKNQKLINISDIDNFECNVNLCNLYYNYCNNIAENDEDYKHCIHYYDDCLLTSKNTHFFKNNVYENCIIKSDCKNVNLTNNIPCIKDNRSDIYECCYENCSNTLDYDCTKYCNFLYDFLTKDKYNIFKLKNKNYLEYYDNDMIVCSLTTIPERLEKDLLKNTIQSVIDQELKPHKIIVNIPYKTLSGKTYNEDKIEELKELENVIINRCEEDYGPITKIFGAINYFEKYPTTKHVIYYLVDDDVIYKENNLKQLYEHYKNNKNENKYSGYGYSYAKKSFFSNKILIFKNYNENYNNIHFLETFAGVIYDSNVFNKKCIEWYNDVKNTYKDIQWCDDIVLGAWSIKNNKELYKVTVKKAPFKHDSKDTPSLSTINIFKFRNNKVYNELYNEYFLKFSNTYNNHYNYNIIFFLIIISILIISILIIYKYYKNCK